MAKYIQLSGDVDLRECDCTFQSIVEPNMIVLSVYNDVADTFQVYRTDIEFACLDRARRFEKWLKVEDACQVCGDVVPVEPVTLAELVRIAPSLMTYHSPLEFDSYPETFSPSELNNYLELA